MTNWREEALKRELERKRKLKTLSLGIIPIWKENNVQRVDFVYSCGNDSFESTEIQIYVDEKTVIENKQIENFFHDAVFAHVNFYEASDGHYIGEAGRVVIELNEDNDNDEVDKNDDEYSYFTYTKEAEDEWSEQESFDEIIELTDEEVEFIDRYVSGINGNMSEDEYNVNYKVDFVQTDELIAVEEALIEKVKNYFENYDHKLKNLGCWHTMEITPDSLDKEAKTIEIDMAFEHTVYKPSEN